MYLKIFAKGAAVLLKYRLPES